MPRPKQHNSATERKNQKGLGLQISRDLRKHKQQRMLKAL